MFYTAAIVGIMKVCLIMSTSEMVSRKERRIKLKRFRDNEMTEPVVTDGLSHISIYEASGSDTRQLPILPIVLSDGQIV